MCVCVCPVRTKLYVQWFTIFVFYRNNNNNACGYYLVDYRFITHSVNIIENKRLALTRINLKEEFLVILFWDTRIQNKSDDIITPIFPIYLKVIHLDVEALLQFYFFLAETLKWFTAFHSFSHTALNKNVIHHLV